MSASTSMNGQTPAQLGQNPPSQLGQLSVVTSTMAAAAAAAQQQIQAQVAAQAQAHAQAQQQAHAQQQAAQVQTHHHQQAQAQALSQASSRPQSQQAAPGHIQLGAPPTPVSMNSYVPSTPPTPSSNPPSRSIPNGYQPAATPTTSNGVPSHPPPATPSSRPATATANRGEARRSEIYRYTSAKPLFASAWSLKKSERFRMAAASVVEPTLGNKVSIIQLDDNSGQLLERGSFQHEFAPNCVGFIPDLENNYSDLIATSADFLRIFEISPECIVTEKCVLTSNKSSQFAAPLTSFDWNDIEPRLIGTSSIDTTCTIYDIEVGQAIGSTRPLNYAVKTQLIAHDRPVHNIAFSKVYNGKDHFATVGADGSARMFDLRHLEHSTIVYEDPMKTPLMRLAWNKHEAYHLATFAQDSTEVIIIDIRMPCNPLCRLKNHSGAVNGLAWAPHSPHHICTAGDDAQALIWDLQNIPRPVEDPILAYSAGGEVNQVHWGAAHTNWICICFNKSLEILRV